MKTKSLVSILLTVILLCSGAGVAKSGQRHETKLEMIVGQVAGYYVAPDLLNLGNAEAWKYQVLLIRVETPGSNEPRFIRVDYRYGSSESPLPEKYLEGKLRLRLEVSREVACDCTLRDLLYVKQELETGVSREIKGGLKFVDNEAASLPEVTPLKCYVLYADGIR